MTGNYLRCGTCNRPMRGWKQAAKDHPGTVARASSMECSGCRQRARRAGDAAGPKRGPRPIATRTAAEYIPARERTPWGQFQLGPSHLKTSIPGADRYDMAPPSEAVCRAAALTVVQYVPRDEVADVLLMLGLTTAGAA